MTTPRGSTGMFSAVRRQLYERLCRQTGIDPYPGDDQSLPSCTELRAYLATCREAGLLDDPRVVQVLRWLALENRRIHRLAVRAVADLLVQNHVLERRAELLREELGTASAGDSAHSP